MQEQHPHDPDLMASDPNQDDGFTETASDSDFVVPDQKPGNRTPLILIALLLFGGGGTYLMYQRTTPQPAGAADTAAASETIDQFLTDGDANLRQMEALLRDTEQIVQQFLAYPTMNQVPVSGLRTNPFRHELKKSEPEVDTDAIEQRRREEERLAVLQAVQALHLQSIMFGDARRACMINNTLYREGEQVKDFTVETIQQQSVIVRQGPYRFELTMRR